MEKETPKGNLTPERRKKEENWNIVPKKVSDDSDIIVMIAI